jgi:uncharacterized protein (DUF1919 family)
MKAYMQLLKFLKDHGIQEAKNRIEELKKRWFKINIFLKLERFKNIKNNLKQLVLENKKLKN